jgi:hypothetical protein
MRIGIIRYWVGRPAAEHETVERFKFAAAQIGHKIVELRADGLDLSGKKADVDFIINLHFASGKSTNDLTYGALWNPWNFYKGWGLSQTFANQVSNDFLLSCGSTKIDERFTGRGYPEIIKNRLSHTVPDDYIVPELRTDRKLFYIGVNWEKSSGTKGRHHELLKILDDNNVIEIYGPKKVGHVRPWAGFKNYVGELPFDGKSVYEAASRCGAVLVLSSQDHLEDQIMTSRLFEGIASGATIIGDSHPFLKEYFASEIQTFDSKKSFESQAREIIDKLNIANHNPDRIFAEITSCQEILKQSFNLAGQLKNIADHAKSVIESKKVISKKSATAVIIDFDRKLDSKLKFASLKAAGFSKILLYTNQIDNFMSVEGVEIIQFRDLEDVSECIRHYLNLEDNNEFVTFCTGEEEFFESYLDFTINLGKSKLGYFVTGARIEVHDDHYANICNPLNSPWHSQYLPGLVIRKSVLLDFVAYFHNTAVQSLFSENFHVLRDLDLIELDHRSGYRVVTGAKTLGQIQGIDYHKVTYEAKNSVYPESKVIWYQALQQQIRLNSNSVSAFSDSFGVFKMIYHALALPNFLKRILKRLALKLLRF